LPFADQPHISTAAAPEGATYPFTLPSITN